VARRSLRPVCLAAACNQLFSTLAASTPELSFTGNANFAASERDVGMRVRFNRDDFRDDLEILISAKRPGRRARYQNLE
jgi:hypothetical protein